MENTSAVVVVQMGEKCKNAPYALRVVSTRSYVGRQKLTFDNGRRRIENVDNVELKKLVDDRYLLVKLRSILYHFGAFNAYRHDDIDDCTLNVARLLSMTQ